MHWLQSLDTRLFDLINRSLANPFFDWLMPILSGSHGGENRFHRAGGGSGRRPALVRQPARAAVRLLTALIVATNDGLICNTSNTPSAARVRLWCCRRRGCSAALGKATSRRRSMNTPWICRATKAAATACRRRTRPTGLPPQWRCSFSTGKAFGLCCRWQSPFRFRAFTMACIIPATCWPARSRRRLRGGGSHCHRICVATFRKKMVSALARQTAGARAQLENRKLPIRRIMTGTEILLRVRDYDLAATLDSGPGLPLATLR